MRAYIEYRPTRQGQGFVEWFSEEIPPPVFLFNLKRNLIAHWLKIKRRKAERLTKHWILLIILWFVFSLQQEVHATANDPAISSKEDSINLAKGDPLTSTLAKNNHIPVKEQYENPMNILLKGFYNSSIYPSDNIYENWDTLNIFPLNALMEDAEDSVKLILQDRNNFCNYYTPIQGVVTSEYGMRYGHMHEGIDIDLVTGDGVKASFDGMVRIAKYTPSYGNVVILRHYNGLETLYAHLSEIFVEPGEIVNAGETIAFGGNTGRSTGSHLHFELRYKGVPLKPKSLISFDKNCLVSDSIMMVREQESYRVIPLGIPFHIVQKGDYLYRIARRYGLSIDEICRINGIRRNGILRVGQRLRLQEINYAQTFKHQ